VRKRGKKHLNQIQKSVKITRLGGVHRREETVMTSCQLHESVATSTAH